MLLVLVGLGCGKEAGKEEEKRVIPEDDPVVAPPWDETGVDAGLYEEALILASKVSGQHAWKAVELSIAYGDGSCPDVYLGSPGDDLVEGLDDDFAGYSWADACSVGGNDIGGFMAWDADLLLLEDGKGNRHYEGSRELFADALIQGGDETLVFLEGEMSDSIVVDTDSSGVPLSWSYTVNTFSATIVGSALFADDPDFAAGYRANLEAFAFDSSGSTLRAAGNLYLFEQALRSRFDAVDMDLDFQGDCAEEPVGWIAVRANDGFWFEVEFIPIEPLYDVGDTGGADTEFNVCDGCGTLFVRGVDQLDRTEIGSLCPSFDDVFPALAVPPVTEFAVHSSYY